MITGLRLEHFKAHRNLHVDLTGKAGGAAEPRQLTVLVGPNGAGKTSVLQAVHLATGLLLPDPDSRFAEIDPSTCLAKEAPSCAVGLEGRAGDQAWRLTCQLAPSWTLSWQLGDGTGDRRVSQGQNVIPTILRSVSSRFLQLDARSIAAPMYFAGDSPSLTPQGGFAASVLAHLKLTNDAVFAAIEGDLRRLVPELRRMNPRPKKVLHEFSTGNRQWVNGYELSADFAGANEVGPAGLSDGTLVLLAILIALHTADRPILLLDDIEQSLHPLAQLELMRTIRGLLAQKPELQIIATTHSPYILDDLAPSDALVFFPRKDGNVAVRPLSEHPNARSAIGTLSAGQIWSLEPEDWVTAETAP